MFKVLEPQIKSGLPNDSCEWRRSYGRPTRNITFKTASFRKFEAKQLEKYKAGEWSILDQPVLHIYVTECNVRVFYFSLDFKFIILFLKDVETYKASVKEEIEQWLKILTSYNVDDWMILLVETLDVKKTKNILPRTTVLDKIRVDFGSKQGILFFGFCFVQERF